MEKKPNWNPLPEGTASAGGFFLLHKKKSAAPGQAHFHSRAANPYLQSTSEAAQHPKS